jgi:hypothetical protein
MRWRKSQNEGIDVAAVQRSMCADSTRDLHKGLAEPGTVRRRQVRRTQKR